MKITITISILGIMVSAYDVINGVEELYVR